MHLLTLQILTISTSLLAWITITSCCLIQLRYFKKKVNTTTSILPFLLGLWAISTYTLYASFILCQSLSLMPSFNCWALTLLIPLIYLYYYTQITGTQPQKEQWLRHLLPPGILAIVYISMPLITLVPDKQIYSWGEFNLTYPTWWTTFRISCYLICIIQASIYIFHLKRIIRMNKSKPTFKIWQEELILSLCITYFISNLITGYVFDLLINLGIAILGGSIIWENYLNRIILKEFKLSFPQITSIAINLPVRITKKTPKLNEKQKAEALAWLQKPEIFKSKINLRIIAKDILTTPAALSAFIKEETGSSLANYIDSMRLDNAEKILLEQNKSVTEIADEIGFQSTASFYRAFKKRHNLSPLKWKEQTLGPIKLSENS